MDTEPLPCNSIVCTDPVSIFSFVSKVFLTILILAVFIKQANPATTQPNKTHACDYTANPDSTHTNGQDKALI